MAVACRQWQRSEGRLARGLPQRRGCVACVRAARASGARSGGGGGCARTCERTGVPQCMPTLEPRLLVAFMPEARGGAAIKRLRECVFSL